MRSLSRAERGVVPVAPQPLSAPSRGEHGAWLRGDWIDLSGGDRGGRVGVDSRAVVTLAGEAVAPVGPGHVSASEGEPGCGDTVLVADSLRGLVLLLVLRARLVGACCRAVAALGDDAGVSPRVERCDCA